MPDDYNGFEYFGSDNPYVLDYLVGKYYGKKYKIPALTEKNRDFIEGIVKLDSNYGIDDDPESNPDSGFFLNSLKDEELNIDRLERNKELKKKISSSDGKYCGSTAYWFGQMKNGSIGYKKCLLGSIISIDRVNSTHLESSKDGRYEMFKAITNIAQNREKLEGALKNTTVGKEHLIGKMSVEIAARRDGQTRSNISFATKFCSYAAYYLSIKDEIGVQIEYSKYDQVVSNALNLYVQAYLGQQIRKNTIHISSERRNIKATLADRLEIYNNYSNKIGEILCESGMNIDRNEFDHIVWYGLKSR